MTKFPKTKNVKGMINSRNFKKSSISPTIWRGLLSAVLNNFR